WGYRLQALPTVRCHVNAVDVETSRVRLARHGLAQPPMLDGIRVGETADEIKNRLGRPATESWSVRTRRVRQSTGNAGTTTHVIEPAVDARFARLNITRPSYSGDDVARIYEFEVYGPEGPQNLALGRPATGSIPCSEEQGPEKAVNGSVAGGAADAWCGE